MIKYTPFPINFFYFQIEFYTLYFSLFLFDCFHILYCILNSFCCILLISFIFRFITFYLIFLPYANQIFHATYGKKRHLLVVVFFLLKKKSFDLVGQALFKGEKIEKFIYLDLI